MCCTDRKRHMTARIESLDILVSIADDQVSNKAQSVLVDNFVNIKAHLNDDDEDDDDGQRDRAVDAVEHLTVNPFDSFVK